VAAGNARVRLDPGLFECGEGLRPEAPAPPLLLEALLERFGAGARSSATASGNSASSCSWSQTNIPWRDRITAQPRGSTKNSPPVVYFTDGEKGALYKYTLALAMVRRPCENSTIEYKGTPRPADGLLRGTVTGTSESRPELLGDLPLPGSGDAGSVLARSSRAAELLSRVRVRDFGLPSRARASGTGLVRASETGLARASGIGLARASGMGLAVTTGTDSATACARLRTLDMRGLCSETGLAGTSETGLLATATAADSAINPEPTKLRTLDIRGACSAETDLTTTCARGVTGDIITALLCLATVALPKGAALPTGDTALAAGLTCPGRTGGEGAPGWDARNL